MNQQRQHCLAAGLVCSLALSTGVAVAQTAAPAQPVAPKTVATAQPVAPKTVAPAQPAAAAAGSAGAASPEVLGTAGSSTAGAGSPAAASSEAPPEMVPVWVPNRETPPGAPALAQPEPRQKASPNGVAPLARWPLPVAPAAQQEPVESEPPRVYVYRFALAGEALTTWQSSSRYDILSDTRAPILPGLSAAVRIAELPSKLRIDAELGANFESTTSPGESNRALTADGLSATPNAKLSAAHYWAGLRASRPLIPWVAPHVRLWGGLADQTVEVQFRNQTDALYTQRNLLPFGALGAGFSVSSPARYVAGLSLLAEGGYRLMSDVDLQPKWESSDNRITRTGPSLGDLSRSGPYLRVALALTF